LRLAATRLALVKPTYSRPVKHTDKIFTCSRIIMIVPLTIVATTNPYDKRILDCDGLRNEYVLEPIPARAAKMCSMSSI